MKLNLTMNKHIFLKTILKTQIYKEPCEWVLMKYKLLWMKLQLLNKTKI